MLSSPAAPANLSSSMASAPSPFRHKVTVNPLVPGSSPGGPTKLIEILTLWHMDQGIFVRDQEMRSTAMIVVGSRTNRTFPDRETPMNSGFMNGDYR